MTHRLMLATALSLALLGSAAEARQLAQTARPVPGAVDFSYAYSDAAGRVINLAFREPQAILDSQGRAFRSIKDPSIRAGLDREAQRLSDDELRADVTVAEAAARAIEAHSGRRITIAVERAPQSVAWRVSVTGRDAHEMERAGDQASAEMRRAVERGRADRKAARDHAVEAATDHALAANWYIRDVPGGPVRPDYARIARESRAAMQPLAQAIDMAVRSTPRDRVAAALAFFQSIPYDTLETMSREGGGAGFVMPAGLLAINRGDCDTKATALAATLASLEPRVRTMILILPEHAVLGVDLPVAQGDATIDADGRRWVLLEAAGPAEAPVGRISERTRAHIAAGRGLSWIDMR